MKIASLEMKDFKNLKRFSFTDIPSLVVVAGPNGSGKTTIFDAIRVFKEAIAAYSRQQQGATQIQTVLQQAGRVIAEGRQQAEITITFTFSDTEREEYPEVLAEGIGCSISATVIVTPHPSFGEMASVVHPEASDPNREKRNRELALLQYLLGMAYVSGKKVGVIDHIGPDRQFQAQPVSSYDLSGNASEQFLRSLVADTKNKFSNLTNDIVEMHYRDLEEHTTKRMDGIRAIFGHFLPEKEFLGLSPPSESVFEERKILVKSNDTVHDINYLSSGEREILMTYVHLEKLKPTGSIILFDEPELHLNSALESRVIAHLRRVLNEGDNQIWVITHSEEIVASTEYDSLFSMTGGSDSRIVRVTERAEQITLLKNLGTRVALQLTSPRILMVEGDSDATLLPLLYGPLPVGVQIVPAGNKGTLMRLTASALAVLEQLVAEGKLFFIRDRDIEDDRTVLEALEATHEHAFFVWKRYHIENYLLDEDAIFTVLSDPTVPIEMTREEVSTHLRTVADSLQCTVLKRYLEVAVNRQIRKLIVLNPQENLRDSITKATTSRREAINAALDPFAVDTLYESEEAKLVARWDAEWKDLCIGRDVLMQFTKQHLEKHLSYEVFRNKVAVAIQQAGTLHPDVISVMQTVIGV